MWSASGLQCGNTLGVKPEPSVEALTFTHTANALYRGVPDVVMERVCCKLAFLRAIVPEHDSVHSVVWAGCAHWCSRILGGGEPGDLGGGPGDVNGAGVSVWWVAVPVLDLGQGWPGVHGVAVAGGSDHRQLIDGTGVAPASIFFALVAAFTQSGGVCPAGGPTSGPGLAVISIFDGAITARGGTGIISEQQHVGDSFGEP